MEAATIKRTWRATHTHMTKFTYFSYKYHLPLLSMVLVGLSLSACSTRPKEFSEQQNYDLAKQNLSKLFSREPAQMTLTYEEALARGIRYNFDYRIKLVNNALQAGQLQIAEFTMFPDLKTTGSLYTRSNDYSTSSITATGAQSGISTSTPRTLQSMREGFAWNILDFGMGYIRSKQQADRVLIAEEESRKQLQLLAQDIRIAYWKAYSAQKLLNEAEELQRALNSTEDKMKRAIADNLVPKEDILKYRSAMLGGDRQLVQLTQKLEKAFIDLKQLLNLPLDTPLTLKAPPAAISRVQNMRDVDFRKLDTITLINRPELRSQNYMQRIAKYGIKASILQVFPGITLNEGWNYNSNKFLSNKIWMDKSVDVSWSLLNLVALPNSYKTAQEQEKYESLKAMALTMAVMTQTRYAFSRYVNLAKEYEISRKQAANADTLYQLTLNRNKVSLSSKQEVVYSKLQAMIAKMDRDLILADLSTALGELYLSAGFDVLPLDNTNDSVEQTIAKIRSSYDLQSQHNFKEYVEITYRQIAKRFPEGERMDPLNTHQGDKPLSTFEHHSRRVAPTVAEPIKVTETTPHKTDKAYTLQIYGSYHLSDVKTKFAELKKANKNVYYGCSKFNGRDWYVLSYGTYTNPQTARTSIAELPSKFQNKDAFARDTRDIQWTNCEPKQEKMYSAFKKSLKRNLAVKLIKDHNKYAMAIYKKISDRFFT